MLTFLVNLTMANFNKNGFYERIQSVSCTPSVSVHGNQYLFSLSALNILLAITASLGNAVVFFALRKNYQSSCSDFCVGVFAQLLYVVQLLSIANQQLEPYYNVFSINVTWLNACAGIFQFRILELNIS